MKIIKIRYKKNKTTVLLKIPILLIKFKKNKITIKMTKINNIIPAGIIKYK